MHSGSLLTWSISSGLFSQHSRFQLQDAPNFLYPWAANAWTTEHQVGVEPTTLSMARIRSARLNYWCLLVQLVDVAIQDGLDV